MRRAASLFAFLAGLLMAGTPAGAVTPNPHNTADCGLCHEDTPRFGIDTAETVNFWLAERDEPELCYRCHAPEENLHPIGVAPGPEALGTRLPASLPLGTSEGREGKVVCLTCHFIHAANADRALLRGFYGSQQPGLFATWQDLCRHCHESSLIQRSPHGGDERACAFCHQARPREGEPVVVAPRGLKLCNFCHGGIQDRHFAQANPTSVSEDCTHCHDPHLGPERPARLRSGYFDPIRDTVTINPHYRRTLCFACHKEGADYPLRLPDPISLCNRCHASGEIPGDIHPLRKVPAGISPPDGWPVQNGFLTCLTCHLAGHPEDRGKYMFLRGGTSDLRSDFCLQCHDEETWSEQNPHQNIDDGQGCDLCHSQRPVPGRDTARTVRFIADVNILCLRCHEGPPHPVGVIHTMTLPPSRADSIPGLLPLGKHNRITCATCHNPHLESVEGNKLRGGLGETALCARCHPFSAR